jgi:ABC-type multidrug transport system ATPase subunit
MADRIVIINEGKIVAQGTQPELAEQVRAKGETKADLSLEEIFIALLKPKKEKNKEKIKV